MAKAKQATAANRMLDLVAQWISARNAEREALLRQDNALREAIAIVSTNPDASVITLADGSRWQLADNFVAGNTIFRSHPVERFTFKQIKVS